MYIPPRERRRRKNVHNKAHRALPQLLQLSGGCCHWCRAPMVSIRDIKGIIRQDSLLVSWQDETGTHNQLFATVDHIRQVSHGGDNRPSNIVASCGYCNNVRAEMIQDVYCVEANYHCACGNLKKKRDRTCYNCRRKKSIPKVVDREAMLLGEGWEKWPDPSVADPNFGKFQDPVTKKLRTPDFAWYVCKTRKKYGDKR